MRHDFIAAIKIWNWKNVCPDAPTNTNGYATSTIKKRNDASPPSGTSLHPEAYYLEIFGSTRYSVTGTIDISQPSCIAKSDCACVTITPDSSPNRFNAAARPSNSRFLLSSVNPWHTWIAKNEPSSFSTIKPHSRSLSFVRISFSVKFSQLPLWT